MHHRRNNKNAKTASVSRKRSRVLRNASTRFGGYKKTKNTALDARASAADGYDEDEENGGVVSDDVIANDENKLYALSFSACLSMLADGAACGCIAGALMYISFSGFGGSTIMLSSKIKGSIVAALPLGAASACLVIGSKFVSELFGRKKIFHTANVLYLLSAGLASLSTSYAMLIFARYISGLACGCSTTITTVFISECVPAETRGKFTSLSPLFNTIGLMYAFISSLVIAFIFGANGVSDGGTQSSSLVWRLMLLVPILPCLAQECIFRWRPKVCPESPRWLVDRGRVQEAKEIMNNLGQSLPLNSVDVDDPKRVEDSGFWGLFKTAKHIKATSIACGLNMLQQFCGINVIVYYAPKILYSLGYGKIGSILHTVLISTCQIIFGTFLSRKIDVYGRKNMAMVGICGIISGCALLAFSFTSNAAFSMLGFAVNPGVLAIIGILVFRVSFSLSLGPIPFVVASEIFPKDARSSGVALSTLVQWICNVLVTFTFLSFIENYGACRVFIGYTIFGVGALASVFCFLDETAQTKLEDA